MFFTDADVGRDIVVEASNEQGIRVELANQYLEIHRATPEVHIMDSILETGVELFPSVHGVVARPPCPPFSALGLKQSWADIRNKVFFRVFEIIQTLAFRKDLPLQWFVLENIPGLLPDLAVIQRRCRELIPFEVDTLRLSCSDFYLPEARERVFLAGRRKGCGTLPSLQDSLEAAVHGFF